MAAGIKEVASEAGVSIATVSRALRGLNHVNPETRKKILDAAELLLHLSLDGISPKLLMAQSKPFGKLDLIFSSITSHS
jgi:transcriptional regulator with XRE-family HTH domain